MAELTETCARGHRWDAIIGSQGKTNELWKFRSGRPTNGRGWIKFKDGARRRHCRTCWNLKRRITKSGCDISVDELIALLEDATCDICDSEDAGGRWGEFSIDHDHSTHKFRGILCGECNMMLGKAQDNPSRLRAAASYLESALGGDAAHEH